MTMTTTRKKGERMTLVAENRRRWVEALRSGEYRQAQNQLRRGNRYSCLGVACDILGSEDWIPGEIWAKPRNWMYDHELYTLSDRMRAKLGLTDLQVQWVVIMNDYHNSSFEEIADWIEAGASLPCPTS